MYQHPANTGLSGVEVSRNTTEFLSRLWQEPFEMICTNQEVVATAVEGVIFYPIKVWMFFDFYHVQKRVF